LRAPGTPAETKAPTWATNPYKEAYFPVPPMDNFRPENGNALVLEGLGIEIEAQHHEVASGGSGRNRHAV